MLSPDAGDQLLSLDHARLRDRAVRFISTNLASVGQDDYALPLLRALSVLRLAMLSHSVRALSESQRHELVGGLIRVERSIVPLIHPQRWYAFLNAAATAISSWAGDPRWRHGSRGVADACDLLAAAEHELMSVLIFDTVGDRNVAARQHRDTAKPEMRP